jgi:cytochrome c oxidase subunit IV
MTRRIFSFVIIIAIAFGIYLFITKEMYSKSLLIMISTLIFLVFSFGIQGLIAHSLRPPTTKGGLIVFPLLMWVLWAVMFLLFVFLIIPMYCPDFLLDI